VGNRKSLIFHDIHTDAQGRIVPWYADDPGTAYDHVLGLLWHYWKYMPSFSSNDEEFHRRYRATAGVKKYFVFRTLDEPGVGGDQFAMMRADRCKARKRKAMKKANGECAGASGARGRRFESCQAHQVQHDVLNTRIFEP